MKSQSLLSLLVLSFLFIVSCSDDSIPPEENEEEVIDRVALTFTPMLGGNAVLAEAIDPDGDGPQGFTIDEVNLQANTDYTLGITLENTAANEELNEEINNEADEHQFFFAFTNDLFSDPAGDGNVDNRSDAINYADEDDDGLPLGLFTNWTTASTPSSGNEFRVVLKHQPGIKSATSTSEDGETDVDLTWAVTISQ
ncbi:MAG: hypothetical protein RIM99_13465 [Cyclobacteriaceae bacterium]